MRASYIFSVNYNAHIHPILSENSVILRGIEASLILFCLLVISLTTPLLTQDKYVTSDAFVLMRNDLKRMYK